MSNQIQEGAIVELNGQYVRIFKVPRHKGFMFSALGRESLPLAVDLGGRQASAWRQEKGGDTESWDDYVNFLRRITIEGELPISSGLRDRIE